MTGCKDRHEPTFCKLALSCFGLRQDSGAKTVLEEARAMARGTQELRSIQILRAVAVLQVVFLHFAVASSSQAYLPVPFFTDFGWLGVRLFFVISGFIIAVTIEKEPSITRYLLKRYFRIFPLYMVATLVTLLGLLVAQDGLQVTTRNDFGNVIHLQGPRRALVGAEEPPDYTAGPVACFFRWLVAGT